MKEILKKTKWKYVTVILAMLAFCLVAILGRKLFYSNKQDNYNDSTGTESTIELSNQVLRQYLTISEDIHDTAYIMSNNSDKEAIVKATMYRVDNQEQIVSTQFCIESQPDVEQIIHCELATDGVNEATDVYIEFEQEAALDGVIFKTLDGDYPNQQLWLNGESSTQRLRMSVIYEGGYNYFFLILFILLGIVIVGIWILPKRFAKIENYFVLVGVMAGLAMAVIGPATQECDGIAHLYRSMDVSYGNFFGSFGNFAHEGGVVRIPENIVEMYAHELNVGGGEGLSYIENLKDRTFSSDSVKTDYAGSVTSIVYWPQGLGILVGRVCKMSMYGTLLMGRIFNLLAYIVMVFFAIRLIPCYKRFIAAVALMPISIYQASSLSQDAMLHGMGFLFIALCFCYAFGECTKLNWKKMLPLGMLLLGMFLSKYVYVMLGLLVFMIPQSKFGEKKNYWKAFVITTLPLLIIMIYIISRVSSGLANVQGGASTGGMTQMQFMMNNPLQLIKILGNTVLTQTSYYLFSLNRLGTMNVDLDFLFVIGIVIIALIGCVDVNRISRKLTMIHRALLIVVFGLISVAIMIGIYLDGSSNAVGSSVVAGVQGRYFLILLPLPFMALGSRKLENEIEHFDEKVTSAMGLMLIYGVVMLIRAYY